MMPNLLDGEVQKRADPDTTFLPDQPTRLPVKAPHINLPDRVTNEMLLSYKRLGDTVLSQVWQYNEITVLKRCEGASAEAEVAAMRLVRERTSIPVPRTLKSFKQPECDVSVIFMEYVDGDPLDQAWDTFNQDQKQHIIAQLRCYLDELRQIKGEFIGSVDGSVCCDQIFANRAHDYGPYESEEMFRSGIIKSLRACDANPAWTEVVAGFVRAMPKHDGAVLTHGDLVPRNILVKDGLVAGIVDWEMAGFFPLYWEYTKAHFFADYEHSWMEEKVLDQILDRFPVELGLLLHTRKIFLY
ncbi:hypothetical protein SCUP234_12587 [Seiridium cupressi]